MLMSTGQVARYVKVSTSTVRDWALKGYLPIFMKTPTGQLKFQEEDVEEFVRKCKAQEFPSNTEN